MSVSVSFNPYQCDLSKLMVRFFCSVVCTTVKGVGLQRIVTMVTGDPFSVVILYQDLVISSYSEFFNEII